MMIKIKLQVTLLLLSGLTGFAQVDKIDTDRPDQTESAVTVPKKWVQLEMGFMREREKITPGFNDYYIQHPTLLTKYGLGKRVEIRLITEFATYKDAAVNGTFSKSGINAVELGGKLSLLEEKGLRPKTSLIAHYDFARLRTLYKDSIDGVNFRFSMQHTLSKLVSLGYNIGMEWERFGSPPAYVYTLAPGFNISEKWYAYIEIFGSIWKYEAPENSVDCGIAYYISDNFKVDLSAGLGINKKAPDNYFAIGASFRFKTGK